RPRHDHHLGSRLLRRRRRRSPVAGHRGGAPWPCLSRALRPVRLDRPAALGEPHHRAEMACRPVLPGSLRLRPARGNPRLLPHVLSRRTRRRRTRRPDRVGRQQAGRVARRAAPALLAVALVAVTLHAVLTGPFPISAGELAAALRRYLGGEAADGPVDVVLFSVRLPRVAAALLAGAALAA